MDYIEWIERVDFALKREIGLPSAYLPNWEWSTAFADGLTAGRAVAAYQRHLETLHARASY